MNKHDKVELLTVKNFDLDIKDLENIVFSMKKEKATATTLHSLIKFLEQMQFAEVCK